MSYSPEWRNEIQLVLDAILVAAKRDPHLRVGQLIDNAIVASHDRKVVGPDLFHISDGELIAALLDYVV